MKYHINPKTMRPNICRAKTPEACLYYNAETSTEAPHFETKEEAREHVEKTLEKEYAPGKKTLQKEKEVRYSFLKKFNELEAEFQKDFGDYPKRFFNKNLRQSGENIIIADGEGYKVQNIAEKFELYDDYSPEMAYERALNRYSRFSSSNIKRHLAMSVSEPKDANIPEKEFHQMAENLGITNLKKFEEGAENMSSKYGDFYTGEIGEKTVFITTRSLAGKNFNSRRFRNSALQKKLGLKGYSLWVDKRHLVGVSRIQKHTEENLINEYELPYTQLEDTIKKLEKDQDKANDFIKQKNHVKATTGAVATAWMDKKYPDKTRQEMMKTTSLNKVFHKVEIDNDVDPKEYSDFEQAYHEVESKLPEIPKDRQPVLRLRKLGKHKASGLFFPTKNTVAIDIRDSGSTIHEMAHYYDYILKDNISLSEDFRKISKKYGDGLKMPAGSETSKYNKDYYTTNTEVHSRLFEIWAHERLGINNRLLNPTKFKNFDYEPIMTNPELKKEGFAFLDKVYGRRSIS